MSQIASRATLLAMPLPADNLLASASTTAINVAAIDMAPPSPRGIEAGMPSSAQATPTNTPHSARGQVGTIARPAIAQAAGGNDTAVRPPATAVETPAPAAATAMTLAGKATTTAQVGKPALPHSPATAGSIGGAVVALVFVIGLILALAWLAKRMPGFRGATANPALRVVGSLALGPRERIVVVAVGDTQLLLGVGTGGIRTLHTLAEPLSTGATTASPPFAQLLAQHFGKKA